VIVDPGAIFSGPVNGGNTIGSTQVGALEFAVDATIGTASGLGTQYVDFARITVDPAATWLLSGGNTLVSGVPLVDSGTLSDPDVLLNDGGIVLDPGTMTIAGLTGTGTTTIGDDSTLEVQGTIANGETIIFAGIDTYLHIDSPAAASGSVTNFGVGATIDLKGIDPATIGYAAGQLNFAGGGFPLAVATGGTLQATASSDGTALTVVCFRAGTRIATEHGEVSAETLVIGDRVHVLLDGTFDPVVWIGHRHVDCARHPKPHAVWPVRLLANAFGNGRPHRDLWLSPDHAIYVGGVLIPVKYLINGTSIAQVPLDEVTYCHVELSRHNVLLAEGLSVESYLDTGNRASFANNGTAVALHPDFASCQWEAKGCAPLLVAGARLQAVRRWLNRMAAATGSGVSRPGNSAASGSGSDASICVAPSPRSAGYARASR
jgi:hypothetical protein